jgi:serine/threonine protein kinase
MEKYESEKDEIDKYEIVKQIGKGSFSNVFLCKQDLPLFLNDSCQLTNELFIIKEININELVKKYVKNYGDVKKTSSKRKKKVDPSFGVNITPFSQKQYVEESKNIETDYYYKRLEELIESEIDVLKSLDNENIIKFYGYSKRDGIYYLRMEYCDGGDVYEYLKGKCNNKSTRNDFNGVSQDFLYDFLKQTTDALLYLHNKNIIHRDIKLHNVLMKRLNGQIIFKISDFGFACYDMSNNDNLEYEDDILSRKYYKLCGTPYYMAPEIILNMYKMENITSYKRHKKCEVTFYDKKIDVWSYGICVYELIFNILPFSNIKNINELEDFFKIENIQEILDNKIRGKKSINNNLKELLILLLQIDAYKRYSIYDVKEFLIERMNNKVGIIFVDNESSLMDMINCNENTYKKNEVMKEHIVRNPILNNKEVLESTSSWERINKSSSLIMKTSVKKGFLNWLID